MGRSKRLREELEKPVATAWRRNIREVDGWTVAFACPDGTPLVKGESGWWIQTPDGTLLAHGPETGDAGRHAADLALLAAGYRLVGGVHPLPEVRS